MEGDDIYVHFLGMGSISKLVQAGFIGSSRYTLKALASTAVQRPAPIIPLLQPSPFHG